ncbi:ribose-5-phosphate isomerase RpiA [Paenibacillus sp. NPDC056579]|uniref:ribose-5-phosphate isomerase RpiA n=1 Tax=Paenibacillus sp. NPDC056579 TaxID=3345871 RepID=UPI0036CE7525
MNPKKLASDKAIEYVTDGMIVGLGTGSTAYWAIEALAKRVREGLNIRAVASSNHSEQLAKQGGIPLVPFSDIQLIDVTIDGADEVDSQLNLIKGGGGALLREKILAANSKTFIVIVDESKKVEHLGHFPLPVEIVPFAESLTIRQIQQLDCTTTIRTVEGKPFVTDNGNLIVDCEFGKILDPIELHKRLNLIPGVVENGLFPLMASKVIVGHLDGSVELIDSADSMN